jgi:hypothetical protein
MNAVKIKYSVTLSFFTCLLLSAAWCRGQFEVSSGFDLSYPLLVNRSNAMLNYGQISFGVRAGLAYKPPETQFFPILNVSFGRTRLPLLQTGKNVTALNFNYLNVMINENYILNFPNSEVFIYGGIGFSDLMRQSIVIAGPGSGLMKAQIDSTAYVTNVFPAMNIGFEYNYGQSAGKDLYLTMGLNFQYIMLLADRNDYYITIRQSAYTFTKYTASLTGNLVTPSFYIAIHYLLHRHKKGGMYL